jgi:hypothetical protein
LSCFSFWNFHSFFFLLSATSRPTSASRSDELVARDSEEEQDERDDLDSAGRPYPTLAGHTSDDTDDDGGLLIDERDPADADAATASAKEEDNMAMDVGG